jgi:Ferritin-like
MTPDTIQLLMQQPAANHDVAWLQNALQAAIQLELATLPPYLSALFSIADQTSTAFNLINDIVFNEMTHFGLACNLLAATGGQPTIVEGYRRTVYPGPLPGGVKPKCDDTFRPIFQCDPDFQVVLGFNDLKSFAKMAMQIDYPEDPVPRPVALALVEIETFPSIGEFYKTVEAAFTANTAMIPYTTTKQLTKPRMDVTVVDSLASAVAAIDLIRGEGEGSSKNPFFNGKLSHFYAFGELFRGAAFVFDDKTNTGDWTGAPVPPAVVAEMTPIPEGGYMNPPAAAVAPLSTCDQDFTDMLTALDAAWANGSAASLGAAIGSMVDLGDNARTLLTSAIARTDAPGIYGPQFRLK